MAGPGIKPDGARHLADICADCLLLSLQLRDTQNFGTAAELRQKITSMLDDIEREAKRNQYTMDDIQKVKFALVAFLDETIIAADWSGKDEWIANPLQVQLFNRFDAGDEFYQKLEDLLDEIRLNSEVLEVYYLCLTLGFKGKYAYLEQEKLRVIIDDVHQDLKLSNPKAIRKLAPHGNRNEEIAEVIQSEIPLWSIGVGAAAVGLVIYFIYSLLGLSTANNIIHSLSTII